MEMKAASEFSNIRLASVDDEDGQQPPDYRLVLKAKFQARKRESSTFSVAYLARRIGCSESFIKKLFARKVHLGFKYTEGLFKELALTPTEEEKIMVSVILNSLESSQAREFFNRLLRASGEKKVG